jgi:hypothetical protein
MATKKNLTHFRLAYAKELEEYLSQSHPKCVDHGFTIAFMNK